MSKQLKLNEWIELFNLYESNNCKNLWIEYAKYKNFMHNKDMNSLILDRQVGRIINKLGLFCDIRIAKKIKELKNTKVEINNLVLRDYDNEIMSMR